MKDWNASKCSLLYKFKWPRSNKYIVSNLPVNDMNVRYRNTSWTTCQQYLLVYENKIMTHPYLAHWACVFIGCLILLINRIIELTSAILTHDRVSFSSHLITNNPCRDPLYTFLYSQCFCLLKMYSHLLILTHFIHQWDVCVLPVPSHNL